jgi:hypothetical protein
MSAAFTWPSTLRVRQIHLGATTGGLLYVRHGSPQTRDRPLTEAMPRPVHVPFRGAHVFVDRDGYTHHGIDCGDGTVIDFGGLDGGHAEVRQLR